MIVASSLRLSAILCLVLALPALAEPVRRDQAERGAFKRANPCPSTGQRRGACPGYVIDHVKPLCAGGPDQRDNMQWQTVADGLEKDKWERRLCRK